MDLGSLVAWSYLVPVQRAGTLMRIFWPAALLVAIGGILMTLGWALGLYANRPPGHSEIWEIFWIFIVSGVPFFLACGYYLSGLKIWLRLLIKDEPPGGIQSWIKLSQLPPAFPSHAVQLHLHQLIGAHFFVSAPLMFVAILIGAILATPTRQEIDLVGFAWVYCTPILTVGLTLRTILDVVAIGVGDYGFGFHNRKRRIDLRDRLVIMIAIVFCAAPVPLLLILISAALPVTSPPTMARLVFSQSLGLAVMLIVMLVLTTMVALFYRYRMEPDQAVSAP